MTFDEIRQIALSFPEMQESTSYGTPAFKVRKKLVLRLREDNESIALKLHDEHQRDFLLQNNPVTYFMTDHYQRYDIILVKIANAVPEEMQDLIEDTWRRLAPKRAIAQYDS